MSESMPDRRSFLKAGALIAAPALAASAPASAGARDDIAASDEAALRSLMRDYVRNAGQGSAAPEGIADLCGLAPDHFGAEDAIAIDAAQGRASGRFAVQVETETLIDPSSTFAQMAIAQGGGRTRARIAGSLLATFARDREGWRIAAVRFEAG